MRILMKFPARAVPRLHLVPDWLDARRLELVAFPLFLLMLAAAAPSHVEMIAWNDQPAPPPVQSHSTPAWIRAASQPNLLTPAPPVLPARFYDLLTALSGEESPGVAAHGSSARTLRPMAARLQRQWTRGSPARRKALQRALRSMATAHRR